MSSLGINAGTRVQDTRPRHQRLEAAPRGQAYRKTSSTKLLIDVERAFAKGHHFERLLN